MSEQEATTKVIFRKWKDTGDVIALFPEEPADAYGWYCNSYGRIGGHASAHYHNVIDRTRPAAPEEYADLKKELERSYDYKLEVHHRAYPSMHNRRMRSAERYRANA